MGRLARGRVSLEVDTEKQDPAVQHTHPKFFLIDTEKDWRVLHHLKLHDGILQESSPTVQVDLPVR
jgi:hypothetical protein